MSSDVKSETLLDKDRMRVVADEQSTGVDFEGESERERSVGKDRLVTVDIFKRTTGSAKGTYWLRVSLRCPTKPQLITRHEIDLDTFISERDFLRAVEIGGGAIAERQCEKYGADWDCEFVASQAKSAAQELLREYQDQG